MDRVKRGIGFLVYGSLLSLKSFPISRLFFIVVTCRPKSSKICFLEAGLARFSMSGVNPCW